MVEQRTAPFILNYRMNAGYIPQDHWVHSSEGGGRNLGEACHIYDLFTFLSDAHVVSLSAHALKSSTNYYGRNDNFVATFTFADGSVANLIYTASGNQKVPKETAELYFDGKIAILDDYKSIFCLCMALKSFHIKVLLRIKGLEMSWIISPMESIRANGQSLWWQQVQVTEMAFAVEEMLFEN